MTVGLIDNTCIYDVAEALSRKNPDDCSRWEWTGAIESACAVVGSENLRLAPSPTRDGAASGAFGRLQAGLREHVGTVAPTRPQAIAAGRKTKAWCKANASTVVAACAELAGIPDYEVWMEWGIENRWQEHSARLNGLFDPDYISQYSRILGFDRADIISLWEASADKTQLDHIVRVREQDERYAPLKQLYVVSALVRGVYHDLVAEEANLQIMHHPLRQGVLTAPKANSKASVFEVGNTEAYLSNIILAAAFSQRAENRIPCWVESVKSARRANLLGTLDLRPKDSEKIGLQRAVDAAKTLDIAAHSKTLEKTLTIGFGLGMGGLTSFVITDWPSFVIAVASTFSANAGLSHRAMSAVSSNKRRLKQLAQAGPGRVERRWTR